MNTYDAWYPQLWVRIVLKINDFRPQPYQPVQRYADGDPIDISDPQLAAFIILPTSASITRNSYRKADECSVTIPYARLPFPPQIIKHASVQVFAGGLDPFKAAAVYGSTPPAPIELIPEVSAERSNEIFRGYVDDWEIALAEGDEVITLEARDLTAIPIDAELPADALAGIPRSTPINKVIRDVLVGDAAAQAPSRLPDIPSQRQTRLAARKAVRILRKRLNAAERKQSKAAAAGDDDAQIEYALQVADLQERLGLAEGLEAAGESVPVLAARYGLPEMRGLSVVAGGYEGDTFVERDLPEIGQVKGAEWFDSAGTTKKSRKGAAQSGKQKLSYWDMITDLVVGSGYICYFGPDPRFVPVPGAPPPSTVLVITEPQTYYRGVPELADDTHTFAYGANATSMTVKLGLAGETQAPVVAQAIEDETGRTVFGVWPPDADLPVNRTKQATPPGRAGAGDRVEIKTFNLADRVPAEGAFGTMERIARSIYDQISMGDLEVSIATDQLSAKPANTGLGATDMLELAAGTPIRFGIRPSDSLSLQGQTPLASTVGDWTALSQADKVGYLVGTLGLPVETAEVIATAVEDELVPDVVYCTEVQIDYAADTGYSFGVKAINYVDSNLEFRKAERARAATVALLESSKTIQGIIATRALLAAQGVQAP